MLERFTKSAKLSRFFRDQGIYLFIALIVSAIFWAIGQPANPFTVILYSLCIGNFLSPPVQWLHFLYEKPSSMRQAPGSTVCFGQGSPCAC